MLHAYFDDELVGEDRETMERHLRSCKVCTAALTEAQVLRQRLAAVDQPSAPRALVSRIRAELAKEAEKHKQTPLIRTNSPWLRKPQTWVAGLLGAGLAAFALALIVAGIGPSSQQNDVLTAHLRAMLQDNPIQIAASDGHAVKPWFNGRVDFAPSVKDLTGQGFPLIGGRLDYVGGKKVGVLVYTRRKHVVNIFMWATPPNEAASATVRSETLNGHNMLTWSRDGVTYTAISDLNATELAELQRML